MLFQKGEMREEPHLEAAATCRRELAETNPAPALVAREELA